MEANLFKLYLVFRITVEYRYLEPGYLERPVNSNLRLGPEHLLQCNTVISIIIIIIMIILIIIIIIIIGICSYIN